jgi:hypothetical protein
MTKDERDLMGMYNNLLEEVRKEVANIAGDLKIQAAILRPFLEQIESHEQLLRGDPKDATKVGLGERQNDLERQVKNTRAISWLMITTFVISAASLWLR